MTTRCAVLGAPIDHSLSPVLHRAAYRELGLDWTYDAIEMTPSALPGFFAELDQQWRGLSLTMPLKRSVIGLLDHQDEWVRRSGAANTVVFEDRGRSGYNTDIPGARAAMVERSVDVARLTILGAGATAASVGLAAIDLGCRDITVAARNPANAVETVHVLRAHSAQAVITVAPLSDPVTTGLLVSTIPAAAESDIELRHADAVFEVVYDPWPTPLAKLAIERGLELIDGMDLLAHQAVDQVRLMTGQQVAVDILRTAGRAALA